MVPVLCVCIAEKGQNGDSEGPFEAMLPSDQRTVSSLEFPLYLNGPGTVVVHVLLDGMYVNGSPFNVTVLSRQCKDSGEVNNEHQCKCKAGYRRKGESCVKCDAGQFNPKPSNNERCLVCQDGYFSESGSGEYLVRIPE